MSLVFVSSERLLHIILCEEIPYHLSDDVFELISGISFRKQEIFVKSNLPTFFWQNHTLGSIWRLFETCL